MSSRYRDYLLKSKNVLLLRPNIKDDLFMTYYV